MARIRHHCRTTCKSRRRKSRITTKCKTRCLPHRMNPQKGWGCRNTLASVIHWGNKMLDKPNAKDKEHFKIAIRVGENYLN